MSSKLPPHVLQLFLADSPAGGLAASCDELIEAGAAVAAVAVPVGRRLLLSVPGSDVVTRDEPPEPLELEAIVALLPEPPATTCTAAASALPPPRLAESLSIRSFSFCTSNASTSTNEYKMTESEQAKWRALESTQNGIADS